MTGCLRVPVLTSRRTLRQAPRSTLLRQRTTLGRAISAPERAASFQNPDDSPPSPIRHWPSLRLFCTFTRD